jgi:nitronate monooxygenase
MFLISGPELVLAACRAGIVGAFPTPNARPIETLDAWMRQITEGVAQARDELGAENVGPWCANLVTHSSNTRLPEDLALIAKYNVINLTLARKAAAAGADGLACVSAGAGGHTGFLSPFAFVSAIREFFDGTVVVGGGISDGWGVAGAIASGADLVYMGTRFIPTTESMAPQAYKQMVVDASVDDLLVSAGVTGTPASWLKPSLRANGLDPENMPDAPGRQYDSNQSFAGKKWADVWAAGQGVGSVRAVEPVAQVVDRLASEYAQARQRWAGLAYAPQGTVA